MGLFTKRTQFVNYPMLDPALKHSTDIVGESFYQDNLATAAACALPENEYHWVALRPEPKNVHDPRAIRVDWIRPDGRGWLTCGYIARTDTESWHALLAKAPSGTVWAWPATLMGGPPEKSWGLYFSW